MKLARLIWPKVWPGTSQGHVFGEGGFSLLPAFALLLGAVCSASCRGLALLEGRSELPFEPRVISGISDRWDCTSLRSHRRAVAAMTGDERVQAG